MRILWQSDWGRNLRSKLSQALCITLLWFGSEALAAVPAITNVTLLPSRQVQLQLVVEVGKSYTFEVSTNLVHWQEVGGIENVPTNFLVVVDEDPVDRAPALFYRMREGRYLRFDFGLMHTADAGQFIGGALTPSLNLPLFYKEYCGGFDVEGDSPYPLPEQIFFTGPTGSGLNSAAASTENYNADEFGAWYQSPFIQSTTGAPAGNWTVNYRGTNMTFASALQPLTRLVVPVPTVTLTEGMVRSVSWIYRDRVTGNILSGPPAYMQSIQVQIDDQTGRVYNSPDDWNPADTTHELTSPVTWSTVGGVYMGYDDLENNHYVLFFTRP